MKNVKRVKLLKQLKSNVYDYSMKKFEDIIEAVEHKHKNRIKIIDYTSEIIHNQIYYYVRFKSISYL